MAESLTKNGISLLKANQARAEINAIGKPSGEAGSSKRSAWFRKWEDRLPDNMKADQSEDEIMRMLMAQDMAQSGGGGVGMPTAGNTPSSLGNLMRRVHVKDLMSLKRAVNESPALEWDARMSQLAGAECQVQQDDTDGTSKV